MSRLDEIAVAIDDARTKLLELTNEPRGHLLGYAAALLKDALGLIQDWVDGDGDEA